MTPSLQDFINGNTLAGSQAVSGAQIDAEVLAATPFTDKGLIMWTADIAGQPQVPQAQTYTKWQTYFWGRIQPVYNGSNDDTPIVTVYFWNPNSASIATYLQWQTLLQGSIGAGQILGSMIAAGQIVDSLMASCNWTKLIAVGATSNNILAVAASGASFVLQTPPLVYSNALTLESALNASALQNIQINATGNGYQFSSHNVLQIVAGTASNFSSTSTYVADETAMVATDGIIFPYFGAAGTITFTPMSALSTIFIEMDLGVTSTEQQGVIAGLFLGTVNLDTKTTWNFKSTNPSTMTNVRLTSYIASNNRHGFGGAMTFSLRFALAIAATGAAGMGTAQPSFCTYKITEYL